MPGSASVARFQRDCILVDVNLPALTVQRLFDYSELLARWNRIYNLTAVSEPGAVRSRHLLDCLGCMPFIRGRRILDVGSGAGLPGLIFAIANPDWHCTLVDPSLKRTRFLQQVRIELGLDNVTIHRSRIQEVTSEPPIDTLVSRGFARLPALLAATRHLHRTGRRLCAMLGRRPAQDLAALAAAGYLVTCSKLEIPHLAAQRHVAVVDF